MKNPIIFVDVDNTLVNTRPLEYANCVTERGLKAYHVARMSDEDLRGICGPDDKVVHSRHAYISRLRPGARELLAGLKQMGLKVYALSNGMTGFVKNVMAAHGLDQFLDGMYGRDAMSTMGKVGKDFLLIDDRDLNDPITFQKMYHLGALKNVWDARKAETCLEKVSPYNGEADDAGLLPVLDRVRERLS